MNDDARLISPWASVSAALFLIFMTTPAIAAGEGRSVDLRGELRMSIIDDFAGRESRVELELVGPGGKAYRLRGFHSDMLPDELRHGATVRVRGMLKDDSEIDIGVQNQRDARKGRGGIELYAKPSQPAPTSGPRSTLVIVANFLDTSVACTNSEIDDLMFGSTYSVDGLYREITSGNLGFTGVVAGPYVINVSSNDVCDGWGWAQLADAKAKAQGFNLSSYQHVVYVFPDSTCNFAGMAYLGGSKSINAGYCNWEDVYAHELGHNLGMRHAGTPGDEYGDTQDIMGYAIGRLRQVNAPHRIQQGWIDPARIVDVNSGGTFVIAPLEERESSAGNLPQVLRLSKPDTNEKYFISYRLPIGYDSLLKEGTNLHRHSGTGNTIRMNLFDDGSWFGDAINGIAFTQVSHDSNGATFQVLYNCGITAPTLTFSPNLRGARPGTEVTYSVSILNNDNTRCPASTFQLLSVIAANQSPGLTLGLPMPSILTIAPGETKTAQFSVTSDPAMTDERFSYEVRVKDFSNPVHDRTVNRTFAVDTFAPAEPTNLSATAVKSQGSNRVELKWSVPADWSFTSTGTRIAGTGVGTYEIWRDGLLVGSSPTPSFVNTGTVKGATYRYTVRAIDQAGNISNMSSSISVTIPSK